MRTRSFPRCAEASDAGAKRNAGTTVGEFVTKILVGTLSWTDKSLIDSGRFYPAAIRTPEDRLRYYAAQFPIVEIDSSYYGIPIEQNTRLWVERTPPEFVFNTSGANLWILWRPTPELSRAAKGVGLNELLGMRHCLHVHSLPSCGDGVEFTVAQH